ncbi:MAG TPA: c-type cytochrome [Gemmatimonadales bacterium]|nr:c-type cytochrome [Gemmatimonadales bacterium]
MRTGHTFFLGRAAILLVCAAVVAACHQAPPRPQPQAEPAEEIRAGPILNQVDTVSEQDVLTEGRKVYHGPGLCYACHGGRLQGGPVAPPLAGNTRDPKDTSFAYVLQVVRAGSPHTPMVASQGGISPGEMVQVANYVWAVSNGRSVP